MNLTRRQCAYLLLPSVCTFLAASAIAGSIDIRFLHVSDTHYRETNNTSLLTAVNNLNALPEKTLPGSTELVGKVWGVVHTGDIIDAAGDRPSQWTNFVYQFGLDGTDGILNFPVYEGWGNHDQDTWLTQVTSRITTRNQTRPGVVNKDANSHYSWDWGPVHLVQTCIRVGSTALRYNPVQSYQFLTNDLATQVGNSGRPVIIMHHLPKDAPESDWPMAEQNQYYQAMTNYNVIAILWGHTHAYSIGTWNGIRTICADSLAKGYNMIRITDDKLIIYRRLISETWSTVTIDNIQIPLSQPKLINFKLGSQKVDLEVSGYNCLNYTVQCSTNMTQWDDLSTSNALIMPMKFSVPAPRGSAFYRAVISPPP